MKFKSSLFLAGAAFLPFAATPLVAQQAQPAASAAQPPAADAAATQPVDDTADEEEIVVTGQRARGSVVGDIPPENTLDSRDVRATGASSISELLDALAPQIGSAQGRGGEQPVLLLNGQRVSGFRELRDIPTEAIQRVDILPEEVALKYGYRAEQKVVNIVLRPRFRSTAVRADGSGATEGGYGAAAGDVTRLMLGTNGRTTFNLHTEGNNMLTEDERDIRLASPSPGATIDQTLAARSLIGSRRDIRGSATFNRTIFGDVSGTLNTEFEHVEGHSLIGLDSDLTALGRRTSTDTAHAGIALNGTKSEWRWSLTGNADLERNITRTDRDMAPADRDRGTTASGDLKATANGTLFKLPAGNASTTLSLGGSTVHLDSEQQRFGLTVNNNLSRTTGVAAASFDLPISRRGRDFSALGNLTLNANAELDQLSDFGSLTVFGAGANWSPVDRLTFITSWSREEGSPTINQLGDPLLNTPGTRIFDFTTGQTVFVNAITGGNPDLQADRRNVVKLSTDWQPFAKTYLKLRAEYVHQSFDRPIQGIFGPTPALEAAFPDRFIRNGSGQLVSVDLRPVNFDSARKDTLRVGFDFSKPLKSKRPSQSVIDQLRAQFGGGRPGGGPPRGAGSEGGGGGFGRRGGGGGGGFGSRGRLQFSLTDTITFVDKVTIGPGLPVLDYLHGEAANQLGGTPRHHIEAQGGWSNNGLGARLIANYRSGTTVNGVNGDDLRFSPLATFDVRLFANPGDRPEIALAHPWLRGTQLRLDVTNVFDAKPNVRDPSGMVPLSYQPDLLNPLGRTVMISFRKLFSPPPSFFRQQRERGQQQQVQPITPTPTP